jgi:hypothetical protein
MDLPRSYTISDLLRSYDTLAAYFFRPGNSARPGRQFLDRVLAPGAGGELPTLDKLFRLLKRQNRGCARGFYYPTSGIAAVYLNDLRDPETRQDLLRFTRASPKSFRSDEDLARTMAVCWMIGNMAEMYEAEVNRWFDQFSDERRKSQTLRGLGKDYEEEAIRHNWKALEHLMVARSTSADRLARYAGRCLERDFNFCPAGLVAELVSDAVQARPKMTESQVRYLCGWWPRANETA